MGENHWDLLYGMTNGTETKNEAKMASTLAQERLLAQTGINLVFIGVSGPF